MPRTLLEHMLLEGRGQCFSYLGLRQLPPKSEANALMLGPQGFWLFACPAGLFCSEKKAEAGWPKICAESP